MAPVSEELNEEMDIWYGGRMYRAEYINEKEFKRAIKLLNENNATYESSMTAEYIKHL